MPFCNYSEIDADTASALDDDVDCGEVLRRADKYALTDEPNSLGGLGRIALVGAVLGLTFWAMHRQNAGAGLHGYTAGSTQ